MPRKEGKRRPLDQHELDDQHGAELPDRQALSLIVGPAPAHLLPLLSHAAAAAPVAAGADADAASVTTPETAE